MKDPRFIRIEPLSFRFRRIKKKDKNLNYRLGFWLATSISIKDIFIKPYRKKKFSQSKHFFAFGWAATSFETDAKLGT